MAETTYIKSKSNVNTKLLQRQINESNIVPKSVYISFDSPSTLKVIMTDALSQLEETTLDSIIQSHNPGSILKENYKVEEYNILGQILSSKYYNTKNGEEYSNLVREISYTYTNLKLKTIIETVYDVNGNWIDKATTKFYTSGLKIISETEYI